MPHLSLTERVRRSLGGTATPGAAELAIAAVAQALVEGLAEDGEVRLANFGVFSLRRRAARRLLIPRSGQAVLLPERQEIFFHPAPKTTLPDKQVVHKLTNTPSSAPLS